MAEWYWRANDKTKAIDAQQKAMEALKANKDFPQSKWLYLSPGLRNIRTVDGRRRFPPI